MFVPVSPSGTGKTLIELMASALRSSQAVAAANIWRRSSPAWDSTSVVISVQLPLKKRRAMIAAEFYQQPSGLVKGSDRSGGEVSGVRQGNGVWAEHPP